MNPSISLQFGSKTWNGRYSQLARRSKKIAILREQSGNAPKQRVNFSSCWSHCRTDLCGWECFTGAKDSRGLSSIKRTGKILWKGEHIVKNRNRLRMNRDNVHLHIGSWAQLLFSSSQGRLVSSPLLLRRKSPEQPLSSTHFLLMHLISNQAGYRLGSFHFISVKFWRWSLEAPNRLPRIPNLTLC